MKQHLSLQSQFTSLGTVGKSCLRITWLIVVCVCASSCARPEEEHPDAEAPPTPVQAAAVETPKPEDLAKTPPPKLDEVEDTVDRVFKGAAIIAAGNPGFVVGDFNGDASLDIAVVIKPAFGKLNEMNPEFPSWLLVDPVVQEPGMPAPRVTAQETLLAVIHGYGPDGWRDPQATQTFLLKNSVGIGLRTQPAKGFYEANRGRTLPRVRGDLIGETLQNKPGYLYYTGPTYSWYDPKTFKGEPEKRLVHGRGAVAEK